MQNAYLVPEDFNTHAYRETIEEIARENNDDENGNLLIEAINTAVDEAKGYLSRFELSALFGEGEGEQFIQPTVVDRNLKSKVKDLALWHFMKVANGNIELARVQASYEYAIDWFKQVMRGMVMPPNWVYHNTVGEISPEGDSVHFKACEKRDNQY